MEFNHKSVLLDECIENLDITPSCIYVDGTLGGAGHSGEILKRLTTGHLYCIDRDGDAIEVAAQRLKKYGERVTIIKDTYSNMRSALLSYGVTSVDGILLDLGVSSYQLDEAGRGFSYMHDGPLDMRMNPEDKISAYEVVNTYERQELIRVLKDYGEEPFAKNIAAHIIKRREEAPIETTGQLCEVIKAAIPMKVQKTLGHPAKRSFQAIRIEVNVELNELEHVLDDIPDMLNPGGRVCIITFHSLEDRIVKNKFKEWEDPCTCPKSFPVCVCGKKSLGRQVNKKPIIASKEEMEEITRSQSAKLRVFEKAK